MKTYKIATVKLGWGEKLEIVSDNYMSGVLHHGAALVMVQGPVQIFLEIAEGKATIYGLTIDHD